MSSEITMQLLDEPEVGLTRLLISVVAQILTRTSRLAILNKELAAVFGPVVAVDNQRRAQSGYVVTFIGD